MRILVVEDNDVLADLIVKGLRAGGYATDRAGRADDALHMAGEIDYGAIVLDLGLPDADGLSVLRELRAKAIAAPVLVLTARSGLHDRVDGLRSGADDYLVKPFAFEELMARIEALLRRPQQMMTTTLRLGELSLDLGLREARIGGRAQPFSAREFALLEILLRRKDRVVSKRVIEDQLFGIDGEVSSNAVEVYVHRVRKQLADQASGLRIHTVRGVGYMLAEEP